MIVTDAVEGLGIEAHNRTIERMAHAGAMINTTYAYQAKLFGNWKSSQVAATDPVNEWYIGEFKNLTGAALMAKPDVAPLSLSSYILD